NSNSSLYKLYQPLVGSGAIAFYMSLITTETGSFKDLGEVLNQSVLELEKNREKLEEVYLLRTFCHLNRFIITLQQPKSFKGFLEDELLGRYLITTMGQGYFQQQINKIKMLDKNNYQEITKKFDKSKLQGWSIVDENIFASSKNIRKITSFSHLELYNNVSNVVFPFELRTKANTELMLQLADLYEISSDNIIKFASKAIDRKTGLLDADFLRKNARSSVNNRTVSASANKYDIRYDAFLASFHPSGKIPDSNKRAIEEIKDKYNFKNEIINVLIEYILNTNNMSLNKGLLDHLAGQIDRFNVQGYQDAKNALKRYQTASNQQQLKSVDYIELDPKRTKALEVTNNDNLEELIERIRGRNYE
ncbi:MAG: hypothetical protein ACK5G7_06725, partial [Erysipelotrichaceae bacterium]